MKKDRNFVPLADQKKDDFAGDRQKKREEASARKSKRMAEFYKRTRQQKLR